jgi:hypothetical protein
MVLGNYVIKDMGENSRCFGGIDPFYYQWQLPVLNFILSSEHVSENYG